MGRNSPPRKPYRRKTPPETTRLRTQPWLLQRTFGPLKDILEHIARDGELHAADDGTWIYVSPTRQQAYEVPATLRSYAEVFALVRTRDPACPDTEPLRRAAVDINAGAVSEAVIQAALTCLAALWTYTASQSAAVIADAAQSVTLRAHLNALEHIQDPALVGWEEEGSAPRA